MHTLRNAVAFVLLSIGSSVLCVSAQEQVSQPSKDVPDRVPTDYYSTHTAQWKKLIEAALQAGPREAWEGSFASYGLHGPSPGWMISRKAGYVSLGRVFGIGTVEVQGTRIALNPAPPSKAKRLERDVYEVVRWGDRVYLVPPANLVDFCNDANSGKLLQTDRLYTPYLVREGDDKRQVSGLLSVPDEFKDYLLSSPNSGTAIRVGETKEDVAVWGKDYLLQGTSVILDVGKKHNVRSGMVFFLSGQADYKSWRRGYVISVAAAQCELLVETNEPSNQEFLKPGSRWSTRDPFFAPR